MGGLWGVPEVRDRGQIVCVSPTHQLIIFRNGSLSSQSSQWTARDAGQLSGATERVAPTSVHVTDCAQFGHRGQTAGKHAKMDHQPK
jgi:hypothetical protein